MDATRRPILGLLTNDLVGAYQYAVWAGVDEAARERDCHLVVFSGGEIGASDQVKRMRNQAFETVGPEDVDGLVLLATALGNHMGPSEAARWCERFRPLPVVTLGTEVGDLPAILVDNTAGMEGLVEHLLGRHGRRAPFFIGGPEPNPEARERLATYRSVLQRHGIPIDPTREAVGQFDFGLGRKAMLDFLEQGADLDCVVAANDEMALGALDALQERGLDVPGRVVVAGFDDIEDARFRTPALTTVRQPLREQGRRAVELLLDMLAGRTTQPRVVLPASPVFRRSCGCHSLVMAEATLPTPEHVETTGLGGPDHVRALADALQGAGSDGQAAESLASGIRSDLELNGERTLSLLEQDFQASARRQGLRPDTQRVVSALRRASLPFAGNQTSRLEGLSHQWRIAAAENAVQDALHRTVHTERWTRRLHETSSRLVTSFDEALVSDELEAGLAELGIATCHVVLQEPDGTVRPLLSHTDGVRDRSREGVPIPRHGSLRRLLGRTEMRRTLAIEPLFFQEQLQGLLVVELSPRRGMLYEALRTQLSAALRGARLVREIHHRQAELEKAYETLQANQRQLLLSEKMASLGRLTAGIAHELNTPLSAMRSSLEEIRQLVQEYDESVGDPEVGPDDHRAIASDMRKALDIANRSGEKAAAFVRGIKSQTRDMGLRDLQVFDLVPVVEEAVLLLSHSLREARCEIVLEIAERPLEVRGIPDRLAQVVTNLVTNAIDAMEGDPGAIRLGARRDPDDRRVLEITDAGCGIPEENLTRIFDPLFTTKPVGKGTGLGLTIIHDVVRGEFGGTIGVRSRTGEGTTFTLSFPQP